MSLPDALPNGGKRVPAGYSVQQVRPLCTRHGTAKSVREVYVPAGKSVYLNYTTTVDTLTGKLEREREREREWKESGVKEPAN